MSRTAAPIRRAQTILRIYGLLAKLYLVPHCRRDVEETILPANTEQETDGA
jgi:hypothetical protein